MGKIEKAVSLIILIILLILLAVLFRRLYSPKEVVSTYEVAVIMDNSSEEYWKYFKMGAEKAAVDNNVDLRFIGMYLDMKEEDQLSYMEREIANNVDAIVISPINSHSLEKWLEENKITIPIISVGGKINSHKVIKHIAADNYSMGKRLAEAVALDNPMETCYILYPNGATGESIEERYKGLTNKLKMLNIAYETLYMSVGTLEYGDVYLNSMEASGSIIGLTPRITEQLSTTAFRERKVYGIGITDDILASLEEGSIRKIITQSEYDVGYLSINCIKSYLEKNDDEEIFLEVYEVDKNNMFTKPLEQILFPIS